MKRYTLAFDTAALNKLNVKLSVTTSTPSQVRNHYRLLQTCVTDKTRISAYFAKTFGDHRKNKFHILFTFVAVTIRKRTIPLCILFTKSYKCLKKLQIWNTKLEKRGSWELLFGSQVTVFENWKTNDVD